MLMYEIPEILRSAEEHCPVGSLWLHRKGGKYRVLELVLDVTSGDRDGTISVRYQTIKGQSLSFIRHLDEFMDGRFTRIESPVQTWVRDYSNVWHRSSPAGEALCGVSIPGSPWVLRGDQEDPPASECCPECP